MARYRSDLIVEDIDDDPIALVKVTSQPDLSRDVATAIHRGMWEMGLPKDVPYLLLVSPYKGYLWKRSGNENADTPPNYEFPMDNVIKRYEEDPEHPIYREVLQWIISEWLQELTYSELEGSEEPENTLVLSGFIDSIKDAFVYFGKVR